MAERLSSVSAFFPCYNDAGSIVTMVEKAAARLRQITDDFEVIVVDDGSSDDSVARLEAFAAHAPYLQIVRHERNRGYGAALRSGFEAATRDFVFYTDGDGQYDPDEITTLVAAMHDGIGLVNGYKIRRADPAHRVVIGRAYQFVARALFGITLRDVDCDFRLIRGELLRRIPLTFESGAIGVELVRRLQDVGCRMLEAPVHHYPRLHGQSEFFRVRHVINLLTDLWRLHRTLRRERRAREVIPVRVEPAPQTAQHPVAGRGNGHVVAASVHAVEPHAAVCQSPSEERVS